MVLLIGGPLAPNAGALSLGSIDIKSSFGERFEAEVEVRGDPEKKLEVALGSFQDYRKLEVERHRILDDLRIKLPHKIQGNRRLVRIVSERPLFYPSFNLVIRAEQNGGTLLENYLVTVDFQQSLALNVKGPGEEDPESEASEETVDLLGGGEASPETAQARAPGQETPSSSKPQKSSTEAGTPSGEIPAADARARAPVRVVAKPPTPVIETRTPERLISGAIWAYPRKPPSGKSPSPAPSPKPVSTEPGKEDPGVSVPLSSPPEGQPEANAGGLETDGWYRVNQGDTLFSIAETLNSDSDQAARLAVALWLQNRDDFIQGNMNGMLAGTRLNTANLEKKAAEVDARTARYLLRNQWQEWKVLRKKIRSPLEMEPEPQVQEIPLPLEHIRYKGEIFNLLKNWKKSWEQNDFDRHMASFLSLAEWEGGGSLPRLYSLKRRLFQRHNRVQLHAYGPILLMKGGVPVVSFDQSFYSDKMESFGRKDIELDWRGTEWKILQETFQVKEFREKSQPAPMQTRVASVQGFPKWVERREGAPYVVHASSHGTRDEAVAASNRLREKGFDAYSTPVYLSGPRKFYRVFVGRFSSWELAREVAGRMRALESGRYAVPLRYPHTLEMGVYDSEDEAAERIRDLRDQGWSPFLFVTGGDDFSRRAYSVFLGAFATEEDAEHLSRELAGLNISFTPVTP